MGIYIFWPGLPFTPAPTPPLVEIINGTLITTKLKIKILDPWVDYIIHRVPFYNIHSFYPYCRALARDPSTRHLDELFHLWTGKKEFEGFIQICMFWTFGLQIGFGLQMATILGYKFELQMAKNKFVGCKRRNIATFCIPSSASKHFTHPNIF